MVFRCNIPLRSVTSHLYAASRREAFPGGIHGSRVLILVVGRMFPLLTLAFTFKRHCVQQHVIGVCQAFLYSIKTTLHESKCVL